jgi:hypothetical protein
MRLNRDCAVMSVVRSAGFLRSFNVMELIMDSDT